MSGTGGDSGTGYGRPRPSSMHELTDVGPGTPMGELLRRYWHPVGLSGDATATPRALRVLGEDLVLFRDGRGRPGLLVAGCAHRGTTLYYGRVEERGIRCCYHGWQFDVQGRCIDQPCEPRGETAKGHVRQPWYPVEDIYGLVFAYMGPPEKRPVLPRWQVFENLAPGETIFAHGYTGFGVGTDDTMTIVPMNFLQNFENIMDPFHVPILHTRHSAVQYSPEAGHLPQVRYDYSDLGINYIAQRRMKDGSTVERISSAMMPLVFAVPDQELERTGPTSYLRWLTPVDDTHHALFHAMRVPPGADGRELFLHVSRPRPMGTAKMWSEMTEEEHRQFPTDFEAMWSQGPITLHSEEHLASSDIGVVKLRRLIRDQIRTVREGGDPIGVSFDPAAIYNVPAGNYRRNVSEKEKVLA